MKTNEWFFGTAAMMTAMVAMLVWVGCSCEDSEPPDAGVRVGQPEGEAAGPPPAQEAAPRAPKPDRPPVGESVLYAPADYLDTTVGAIPRAQKKMDVAFTQHEIEQFKALEGRYPRSLAELETWRGEPLPELPKGHTYKYDPTAGKVEVVPAQ